jgi:hypothetical protein
MIATEAPILVQILVVGGTVGSIATLVTLFVLDWWWGE